MKELPSQDYLNSIFEYKNGKLYWKSKTSQRTKIGEVVGSLHKYGYLTVSIKYTEYKVHRLIWKMLTGTDPEFEIDHINHNRSDNRIENLRDTKENHKNKSKYKTNTSGHSNINIDNRKRNKKYQVIFDAFKYFKSFSSLEEAIQHRDEKYIEFGYHENHGLTVELDKDSTV